MSVAPATVLLVRRNVRETAAQEPLFDLPAERLEPDQAADASAEVEEALDDRAAGEADVAERIARLYRGGVSLHLETEHLCFLAACEATLRRERRTSLDEDRLREVYEQVATLTSPGGEKVQAKATNAIQRLRDQRLLARVDGGASLVAGAYALTGLARAIVASYLEDERLTRQSLTVLTSTLASMLSEILQKARQADGAEGWRRGVTDPLRLTVATLLEGIERRQRGLDVQQEELRQEIKQALEERWVDALSRCEALLEDMTDTLRELNQVLVDDAAKLARLLDDVEEAALRGPAAAQAAVRDVAEQVERVGGWGQERLDTWSEYYQYVHRFLRDTVRMDPDQGLTQRLREAVRGYAARPWHLVGVDPAPYLHLRPPERSTRRTREVRPRRDREPPLREEAPAPPPLDPEALVAEALEAAAGAGSDVRLSELLAAALARAPERERFRLVGRIAAALARRGRVLVPRDLEWVSVTAEGGERLFGAGELEVQDWRVAPAAPEIEAARTRAGAAAQEVAP